MQAYNDNMRVAGPLWKTYHYDAIEFPQFFRLIDGEPVITFIGLLAWLNFAANDN